MQTLALIAVPAIFYLLPACVPVWRVFLVVWIAIAALIAIFWYQWIFLATDRDLLTLFFNRAIIYFLIGFWVTAGIVQFIRILVHTKTETKNYRHWILVVAGGLIYTGLGTTFFFTHY